MMMILILMIMKLAMMVMMTKIMMMMIRRPDLCRCERDDHDIYDDDDQIR